MRTKLTGPSTSEVSFCCPHCQALAHQTWHWLGARAYDSGVGPFIVNEANKEELLGEIPSEQGRRELRSWYNQLATGELFLDKNYGESRFRTLNNVYISECFSCKKLSVWVHDTLLYPDYADAPLPHPDMPASILGNYSEAASIYVKSPRGAAAILRLSVEKLCNELGANENDKINDKIGFLFANGHVGPIARNLLDYVRLTGNRAVHDTARIEMDDDTSMVETLFKIVNMIVEDAITRPKLAAELESKMTDGERDQISKRDQRYQERVSKASSNPSD